MSFYSSFQVKKKAKMEKKSKSKERSPSIPSIHSVVNESDNNCSDEEINNDVPFQVGTTVFEDDSLVATVIKERYRRNAMFNLDDHLFVVRIKVKKNKPPPLLREIVGILETIFTFMLDHLRTFYESEDRNLIYMTLYQKHLNPAMNSPAFELQTTSTEEITHHLMTMFNRFINSESEIHLDSESLKIYFDVLSMKHVEYKLNKKVNKRRKKLGCRKMSNEPFKNRPGLKSIKVLTCN